ncbi:MAG: hypothetical protein HQL68_08920, partial [Magnetococcales bacterium]|nr:hypothetical protein [Magnetococcales bacterium]
MEQELSQPNILFQNYGNVVLAYFADDKVEGEPISVIPFSDEYIHDVEPTIGYVYNSKSSDIDTISLSEHIPKESLQRIQEMVDSFRRILHKESVGAGNQAGNGSDEPVLTNYLQEFRSCLASDDEMLLEANPFYELTKQVYKLSIAGINQAFQKIQPSDDVFIPKPVPVSRSLKDIWGDSNSGRFFFDKFFETFGKWIAFGRTPLSLLLFVGSTFTTARGVNDLLQMSDIAMFFGDIFEGSFGENNRYLVSLGSGLLLSSAILDYKNRIYLSTVEAGSVLAGIRDGFMRNPRWMVLATLLTIVSIKTNYDGIVSIISKKEDLAQQSQLITSRVRKALGSPFFMNPLEPDSLFDLQGSFQQTTGEIMELFRLLPEDEVKGVASSADPRKGPRYWAKHFIVHGGYEEGINDVKLAFNDHIFASQIDEMLQNSGIDFSSSFSQKVELLRASYESHLRATQDLVRKRLGELKALMSMGGYSPDEIKRVLALEHYQINDIVQDIVVALEANKQVYKETSVDLSELTNTYLGILQMVDKSGTSGLSAYQIQADVVVPPIEAIDELRKGKIPIAKHKNFEELRASLIEKYGVSLGGLILGAILFFSIGMDLGDPILFSRMTASRGKKDRLFFNDRLEKLKNWEESLLVSSQSFFKQKQVKSMIGKRMVFGYEVLKYSLFITLEDIDSELKSEEDKSSLQRFWHWFYGMFHFSRTAEMAGLNARLVAVQQLDDKRNIHFSVWAGMICPYLLIDKSFSKKTFKEWNESVENQVKEQRIVFYDDFHREEQINRNDVKPDLPNDLSADQKRLSQWVNKKGDSLFSMGVGWLKRIWFSLFRS